MRRIVLPIFCIFCIFLVGCASKSNDIGHVQLENPLLVPITKDAPRFYIDSVNNTQARADIKGLLTALLQSEYGIKLADNAYEADYVVSLRIDTFHSLGKTDAPLDATTLALPVLLGTTSGAHIGADIDGGEGALYGAGIGLVLGLGIGLLSQEGDHVVWQMLVHVDIKHGEENFISRVDARTQGENMDAANAAISLESKVAHAILKAFVKK